MPHQRSPEAQLRRDQRRNAKQYVCAQAFHDNIRSEAVNRLEPEQIREHLEATYSEIYVDAYQFTRGEVIADSKGKGTLQR